MRNRYWYYPIVGVLVLIIMILAVGILPVSQVNADVDPTNYNHIIPFTITDTSGVARTNVPVIITYDTSGQLVAYGLVNATATNTYVDSTGGSTNFPIGVGGTAYNYLMASSNITVVIPSLPAYGSVTINLYTGYSPSQTSFPIITGNNGYITATDNTSLEPSSNFTININGYLDTTAVGGNIFSHTDATNGGLSLSIPASGNITLQITSPSYPAISGNTTADGGGATSNNVTVTYPAGIVANDLILVEFYFYNSGADPTIIGYGSGFTELFHSTYTDTTSGCLGVYYKVAVGGETNGYWIPQNASYWSYSTFKITHGTYNGVPVTTTNVQGSNNAPKPNPITTGWGSVATLWMAVCSVNTNTVNVAPVGYGALLTAGAGNSCYNASAEKYSLASSETSGNFTLSGSGRYWNANIIAIKSAAIISKGSISSGVHAIQAGYASNILWLAVDSSNTTASYTSPIPNSTANWTIDTGNAMPYMDYFNLYAGGVQKLLYQPNAMINGTALLDMSGNGNQGVITWGLNSNITITGGDIATSSSPTSIGATQVLMQGSLFNIGTYTSVYLSFEYGLDDTYGYWTSETAATTTQNFAVSMSGLTPNITYHYRMIVRNGTVYAVGADESFTTLASSGSQGSTVPIIWSAGAFHSYKDSGDWLFTAEIDLTYPPYFPTKIPANYFQMQLIGTDNLTILGATSIQQWGDRPCSIYLNSSANITYGSAYIVRVMNISSANITLTTSHTLTGGDWYGTDLAGLDDWCKGAAVHMEGTDATTLTTPYLVAVSDRTVISDYAAGYFAIGINGIAQIRPNLFQTAEQKFILPTMSGTVNYNSGSTLTGRVGTSIVTDAGTIGAIVGLSGSELLMWAVLGMVLFIIGFTVTKTNGFGALGALALSVPLLGAALYANAIQFMMVGLFVIIMVFLFVRQIIWKTL